MAPCTSSPPIEGVVEDVTEIVLNLKKVLLKAHTRDPQTLMLSANKEGAVTAADIQLNQNIELVNPDQHICTLDKKKKFEMELEVKVGRGFLPGDENKKPNQAIGVIAIDSLFSPVTRVRYAVENARVGQRTDYDRLVLEVWTDGRISPDDALTQASAILQHHLDVFVGYDKTAVEFEEVVDKQDEEKTKLKKLLNMSVNEIELSVRAANCLNNANITTVGQLAMKTESEMLKYRNFGKKSLNEIKEKLQALGLTLGHELRNGTAGRAEGRSGARGPLTAGRDAPPRVRSAAKVILCDILNRTAKLGRTGQHRNAMLANLVCSLIKHKRVTTTLAKAKAARPVAEKMVTLGKAGTLHDRRIAAARLHQEDAVKILFNEIAPAQKTRNGGYTRIVRLHERQGDAAQLAILEFVDLPAAAEAAPESAPAAETKPAPEKTEGKAAEAKA